PSPPRPPATPSGAAHEPRAEDEGTPRMTWTDFYLVCFLVGLALTLVSALGGSSHVHVPHLHFHHGGTPHLHASHGGPGRVGEVSVVNFGTVTAFLAWFGGAGYLMTRYY